MFDEATGFTGAMPTKYLAARLVDLDKDLLDNLSPIIQQMRENKQPNGFVLSGPNGVGKTHAASAVINACVRRGLISRYAFVPAGEISTLWDEYDHFREQSWRTTLCATQALLLDDLGKENRASDYRQSIATYQIDMIMRTRAYEGKTTIITTNLTYDGDDHNPGLRQVYGESLFSLIHEVAETWVEVHGDDRRINRAKK